MLDGDIFGIGLAQLINDNLGDLVYEQTLISITAQRDPNNSSKTIKTRVEYPCKGFVDEYADSLVGKSNIQSGDKKVAILGASLPAGVVPQPGDEIIAEGTRFVIVGGGVKRDPARAVYECHAR